MLPTWLLTRQPILPKGQKYRQYPVVGQYLLLEWILMMNQVEAYQALVIMTAIHQHREIIVVVKLRLIVPTMILGPRQQPVAPLHGQLVEILQLLVIAQVKQLLVRQLEIIATNRAQLVQPEQRQTINRRRVSKCLVFSI